VSVTISTSETIIKGLNNEQKPANVTYSTNFSRSLTGSSYDREVDICKFKE
jgi:hypothetical protein